VFVILNIIGRGLHPKGAAFCFKKQVDSRNAIQIKFGKGHSASEQELLAANNCLLAI